MMVRHIGDTTKSGQAQDSKPRCTVLVQRRLDDLRSGSGVYLMGLIDHVRASGYEVRIAVSPIAGFGSIPFSRPTPQVTTKVSELVWPSAIRMGSVYISTSTAVWLRAIKRGLKLAAWTLAGRDRAKRPKFVSTLGKTPPPEELKRLITAINQKPSVLAIAEYDSLGPALADCVAETRCVALHDLFFLRTESFLNAGLRPDHILVSLEQELEWLRASDVCVYASAFEADLMAQHLPDKRHIWVPPCVAASSAPTDEADPHAVFIGVRHGGNSDALDFLLNDIWPRVLRKMPAAKLAIVGEIGSEISTAPPGVEVLGQVDDLARIGGPGSIGLAPARVSSGVSIKVATYLELGMSVIATNNALEGYSHALDDIVIRADSAEEFSGEIVDLLSNKERRQMVSRCGHAQVKARLENNEFRQFLRDLSSRRRDGGKHP